MRLLSSARSNSKTRKAQSGRPEYRLVSLMLSPDRTAPGLPTNCPNSVPSCVDACVGNVNVGMAQIWESIMRSRIAKTEFMRRDRAAFLKQLADELHREQDIAEHQGAILAVRLNCFSDLPWEMPGFGSIPEKLPEAQFYDYTKVYSRVGNTPDNYHLTASWTEVTSHQDQCCDAIERGHNVAVIFGSPGAGYSGSRAYNQSLPSTFAIGGRRRIVFDGDAQDMRFLDWQAGVGNGARIGRVCGLRLKAGNNAMRERAIGSGLAVEVAR